MQIRKHFTFEAAHVLPHHAGKCSRLHGHSYRLEVALEGGLRTSGPAQGMVEDFDVVGQVVRAGVIERLDHTSLNDLLPNPTAELVALWIWAHVEPLLDGLSEIVLWETPGTCAVVRASDVR